MLTNLIAWLYWLLNFLICRTLKYKVSNEPSGHVLFALWHGQTFPLFYWAQHRKLCLFPTDNWRGEVIDYLAKKYKHKTERFIEEANPLIRSKNLEEFIKIIKTGYDAAVAIDGPPKPLIYHKAKPGILYLSQKTGLPIVPVSINIKRKIILFWRWDRFEIPLPFSEIEIKFGKPFMVDEKTKKEDLEKMML